MLRYIFVTFVDFYNHLRCIRKNVRGNSIDIFYEFIFSLIAVANRSTYGNALCMYWKDIWTKFKGFTALKTRFL